MQQRSRPTWNARNAARTAVRRMRTAFAAGALATALIAVASPAAFATTDAQVGIANNMYPAAKDMKSTIESLESFTAFTANASSQAGGYWNNQSVDTSTMRGITSGSLRQQLKSAGPYTTCDPSSSNNCANGPLNIDAFLSADETNANAVIPTSDGGTCTASASVECNGTISSLHAVAVGHLAIYSCSGSWAGSTGGADPSNGATPPLAFGADANGSGNGKPQSPRCDASPISGGAPTTMSGVVSWLATSGNRIAIADPASAPFGAASEQALIQAGFSWVASGAGQNVFTGSACDSAGTACKVRLESGISQVRGAVTANAGGNTQLGLVAKSNIMNVTWTSSSLNGTTGNDPNTWTDVDPSAYSGYGDIDQYGVALTGGNTGAAAAWDDLFNTKWDNNSTIQSTLAAYGF
ncbi:hypothetical protein [Kitasatospora viridis]|uniref:Alpha-L-arabinofuranosidase B-like protein n=1 Tax=Kitasatospora viridis TaxID=281105 RepID=A0A561SAD8_9ACTN|nr:hypothetical protein [Kitasatospora viridis]TWF71842.1 hypothetical protein FHX73_1739 [Kitasatospora viridis]